VSSPRRIPGLDALRGLSAFGVLLWHYRVHFERAAPFLDWFQPFYAAGYYLVDVFFVLSGFLLGHLYRQPRAWKAFVFKRAARLFPLHWATLIVVAILQTLYLHRTGRYFIVQVNDACHFVLNLALMQQSGLQHTYSFNGPSWSISAEWITNLVFVAVLLLAPLRRWLPWVLAVGSGVALWLISGRLVAVGMLWDVLDAGLLRGMLGFFVGVAMAELLPLAAKRSPVWDGVGLLSGATLLLLLGRFDWRSVPGSDFAMVVVLIPALVAGCSRGTLLARVSLWAPLRWLGDVSFSVYLWHFPIQIFFALMKAYGAPLNYASYRSFLAFLGVTYLAGHLSWVYLERPIQRAVSRQWAAASLLAFVLVPTTLCILPASA
jgi:peptidoglycan/LPS O-acetylase OafA/YrhL